MSVEVNASRAEVCLTRHGNMAPNELAVAAGPVLVRVVGNGSEAGSPNIGVRLDSRPRTAGPVLVRKTALHARMLAARSSAMRRRSGIALALVTGAIMGLAISYHYFSARTAAAIAGTQKAIASALAPGFVETPRTGNDDKSGHSVVPSLTDGARSRELAVAQSSRAPVMDASKPLTPTAASITLEPPKSVVSDAASVPVPDLPQQLFANATIEHPAPIHALSAPPAESADKAAWRSVSPKDQDSLRTYLKDFPTGKYAGEAQHLLTELTNNQSRDADAVLTALAKYSEAWSTKDVADITALRPGLAQRAVKRELASVKSIAMHIRPISSPKIEGDRAAVECIHEVDETFSDGVQKTKPGVRMTYALVKSGGNWLIQDSH